MSKRTFRALLVLDGEHQELIREHLESCAMEVLAASTCREASRLFRLHRPPGMVFTGVVLSDGTWLDVIRNVRLSCAKTAVVVCSDCALNNTHLPLHVRIHGGFGVLATPYSAIQVRNMVDAAAGERVLAEHHGGTSVSISS